MSYPRRKSLQTAIILLGGAFCIALLAAFLSQVTIAKELTADQPQRAQRPQPKVRRNTHIFSLRTNKQEESITIPIGFHFINDGPGVALDLFASFHFLSIPGPNCKIFYEKKHPDFKDYGNYDYFYSIISNPDVRLPPGGTLLALSIEIILIPPFDNNLSVEAILGFGNAPPLKFVFKNSKENVQSWYDRIFPILKTSEYDDNKRTEIVNELLGL